MRARIPVLNELNLTWQFASCCLFMLSNTDGYPHKNSPTVVLTKGLVSVKGQKILKGML